MRPPPSLIRLAWFCFALPRSFCGLDVYRCLSSRVYLVRPCSVSSLFRSPVSNALGCLWPCVPGCRLGGWCPARVGAVPLSCCPFDLFLTMDCHAFFNFCPPLAESRGPTPAPAPTGTLHGFPFGHPQLIVSDLFFLADLTTLLGVDPTTAERVREGALHMFLSESDKASSFAVRTSFPVCRFCRLLVSSLPTSPVTPRARTPVATRTCSGLRTLCFVSPRWNSPRTSTMTMPSLRRK